LFKASYFQTELLYYTLSFFAFLAFCKSINEVSYKNAVFSGALAAVAYLAKATMLQGFLFFIIFQTFNIFRIFFIANKDIRLIKKGFISILLSLLTFLAILSPYLKENKEIFGRYFYNVGTTFYVWNDSWEEATKETRSWGDRTGWPAVPEGKEVPSLKKYIREHTLEEIIRREFVGSVTTLRLLVFTYAIFAFLIILHLTLFLVFLSTTNKGQFINIAKKYFEIIAFTIFYFTLYFFTFAWFVPISSGPRFILSLYMPALFALLFFYNKLIIATGNKNLAISNQIIPLKLALLLFAGVYIYLLLATSLFIYVGE